MLHGYFTGWVDPDPRFAERLYEMITAPKQFIRLPNAGHNDHDLHGLPEMVRPFLRAE